MNNSACSGSCSPPDPRPVGAYVGWDWSDSKHDLCVRSPGQSQGLHETLPNTPEALHPWFQTLRQRYPGQRVVLALEATRSALLPILGQYRDVLQVYWLNPHSLANYRQAFHPSGAKSDPGDCALAADFAIAHPEQLHPWRPQDPVTTQLIVETEQRRHLVDQRTVLANRLKAHLKGYFPQALDWLQQDLTVPWASVFLLRWPTLQALQASSAAKIRRFLRAHRRRLTQRVQTLIEQLPHRIAVSTQPEWLAPAVAYTEALAHQLTALHQSIHTYDQRVATLAQAHPYHPIVAQLPGAGPVLQARLLAVLGSDPQRYADADQLAVISGVAPVKKASGKTCIVHRRYAFPHFVHQTFIEFAKNSIPWCPWATAFVEAKKQHGWAYYRIIRALAFKWIRILYALLQSGQPYDPNHYQRSLLKHQSAYAHVRLPT